MATYPSYVQTIGSTEDFVDDVRIDRTVSGAAKVRSFYSARKRLWTLRHVMTSAEVSALMSFYDSYKTVANTFTWARDSTAYTFVFNGPPKIAILGAGLCEVRVQLAQQ